MTIQERKLNILVTNRRTFIAKDSDKMVELLNDLFERNPWPGGSVRIYKTLTGPFNHVVVETESASLAAYEEQVTKFESNFPEGLRESWAEVAESGGSNELWTLASERRADQSN